MAGRVPHLSPSWPPANYAVRGWVTKYLKGRNGAADLSAAEKGHRAGLTYLRSNAMAWHRAADPAVLKTLLAEIEGL